MGMQMNVCLKKMYNLNYRFRLSNNSSLNISLIYIVIENKKGYDPTFTRTPSPGYSPVSSSQEVISLHN